MKNQPNSITDGKETTKFLKYTKQLRRDLDHKLAGVGGEITMAVVARGMGKCCVCGVDELKIDNEAKTMTVGRITLDVGDWITLNGNIGEVIECQVPLVECSLTGDFKKLMDMCDNYRRLRVRANADTPQDCKVAVRFGAEGVGLCRTQHMFFTGNHIDTVREMVVADNLDQRLSALDRLLEFQREEIVNKSQASVLDATKSKKKFVRTWLLYIFKVLKQVHSDNSNSNKAMNIMNSFINDVFHCLASEANKLSKINKTKVLSLRVVQTSARLLLPGEPSKHAVSEGTKAVANYTSD